VLEIEWSQKVVVKLRFGQLIPSDEFFALNHSDSTLQKTRFEEGILRRVMGVVEPKRLGVEIDATGGQYFVNSESAFYEHPASALHNSAELVEKDLPLFRLQGRGIECRKQ
jgi:hypothetical protein